MTPHFPPKNVVRPSPPFLFAKGNNASISLVFYSCTKDQYRTSCHRPLRSVKHYWKWIWNSCFLALGMSFGIFGADQLQKLIDSSGFGLAYLKSKYGFIGFEWMTHEGVIEASMVYITAFSIIRGPRATSEIFTHTTHPLPMAIRKCRVWTEMYSTGYPCFPSIVNTNKL